MNFWEFSSSNPWLAVAFIVITVICVDSVVKNVCIVLAFRVRHRTLREKGFPPPHCDADGDPINTEDKFITQNAPGN